MKPVIMQEISVWLKSKIKDISKCFTKELQLVINQFIDLKKQTFDRMAEIDWYKENVKVLELTLARKIPCFEAEYGLSESTPLRMYDCLIPKVKEHQIRLSDIRDDF